MKEETFEKMKQFDKDNAERFMKELAIFIDENVDVPDQKKVLEFMTTTNSALAFGMAVTTLKQTRGYNEEDAGKIVLREMTKILDSYKSTDQVDLESAD